MKKISLLFVLISQIIFLFAVNLHQNNTVFIPAFNEKVKGNCFYQSVNGFLTLMIGEDNCPVELTIFSFDKTIIYQQKFRTVINPTISQNKRYFAFLNEKNVMILDTQTLKLQRFPGSLLFEVNNEGFPDYNKGFISRFVKDPQKVRITDSHQPKDPENIIPLHEPILAPLVSDSLNLPIGNSYAELQTYSGDPYLHPGVDFLGQAGQPVQAVRTGFVKAILTTGGNLYWRVAIANEDTDSLCTGYLYAHLEESSINVNIGDYVEQGQIIGNLVEWPSFNFHHCHFARIQEQGNVWDGLWWTVNDPLQDVSGFIDNTPPVFENIIETPVITAPFVFKIENNEYTTTRVTGSVDIVAKCHDLVNSEWKLDIFKIGYKLSSADNPDSILFETISFVYDMPTDVYLNSTYSSYLLNLIYNRDSSYLSIGNYEIRDYYHVISRTDGDSLFSDNDLTQKFDSFLYPDGNYILTVYAYDFRNNYSELSMPFEIDNTNNNQDNSLAIPSLKLKNYPNPFNPSTTIEFSLNSSGPADISIYNIKGQLVKTLLKSNLEKGNHKLIWDGKNDINQNCASGIYYVSVKIGDQSGTKKILLMK